MKRVCGRCGLPLAPKKGHGFVVGRIVICATCAEESAPRKRRKREQ